MRGMIALFALGLAPLLAAGPKAAGGDVKPTKEAAVKVLRDFAAALEAKEYDRALGYLKVPSELKGKEAEFKARLPKMVGPGGEVSAKGVAVLEAQGKWGPLTDIMEAKRAEFLAQRFEAPPEACYGLLHPPAFAGFVWDGARFRIAFFNNIGRLEKAE